MNAVTLSARPCGGVDLFPGFGVITVVKSVEVMLLAKKCIELFITDAFAGAIILTKRGSDTKPKLSVKIF